MSISVRDVYLSQQRTKLLRQLSTFKALIATPGNLATGINLPAGADLFISTSILAATTILITADGRDIGATAGVANLVHRAGYFERAAFVIKKVGYVGTVKLYIRGSMGKPVLIAQG